MSNTQEQIQQIEVTMEEAQDNLDRLNLLKSMEQTASFKDVILEGYFNDEASRLVLLKSDYEMQSPDKQAHIMRQIDAIGTFRQYLATLYYKGNMAEKALIADKQTHEELLLEDAGAEE
jgi:Spy/CpxP family protein refolding chaperone